MPRAGTSDKRSRNRSFGGCKTCRARKVKCDEQRPCCGQCQKASLQCDGFEAKIRWIYYDADSDSFDWTAGQPPGETFSSHSRRVLFTEDERAKMSLSLTNNAAGIDLNQVFEDLEAEGGSQKPVTRGPFGAFYVVGNRSPDTNSDSHTSVVLDESISFDGEISSPDQANLDVDAFWNASLEHFKVFGTPVGFAVSGDDFTGIEDILDSNNAEMALSPRLASMSLDYVQSPLSLHIPMFDAEDFSNPVPSNAYYLLSHYKDQMGKLFSPLRVRKPPWGVLHLPTAQTALSELTLWGKASYAKISLFYALLSVSAFNLDKIQLGIPNGTSFWWTIGEAYRDRAKRALQKCCATEISGPEKAKYKEILMALLTMVTISVVSGQHRDARCFLIDSEHFICLRGITKVNPSRKVRLLHHIYLFLRVVEESTFIYPLDWRLASIANLDRSQNNLQFPSLKTHSLRLGKDIDKNFVGEFETGLFGRGEAGATLFGEIYGIPESLLSLISKATGLANEIEAEKLSATDFLMSEELNKRSKHLENEIVSWSLKPIGAFKLSEEEEGALRANREILHHLVHAIHDALILYFYRRVYNLNSSILQHYVDSATQHLVQCEQKKVEFNIINTGIVWPGFIAAAEALGEARRQLISRWLRESATTSGMRNFDSAADVAEQVWKLRESQPDASWIDVLRQAQVTLVLT